VTVGLSDRNILFSFDIEYTRRVKAGGRTNPGRENPAAGLHASRDSLYLMSTGR
jgi:hypothetical protein